MAGSKCIGILTSGGDAPGMNAAIRAVTRSAIYNGFTVKGIMRGYKGLVYNEIVEFKSQSVSNIIQLGGTILKTAATGSVRQQGFVIARPNEGGVTTHLLRSRTVWTADIDNRFLKNMFQKSLLIHSVLVKFVHIDQCEPIEGYLGISLVTEINAVRVICL